MIPHIYNAIMGWIKDRDPYRPSNRDDSIRIRPHPISLPAIFFDGACKNGIMGCGAWIKPSQSERIQVRWNGGKGTKNLAELMALWGKLLAACNLNLKHASIYEDSKLIIETFQGLCPHSSITAHGWFRRAKILWEKLNEPPLHHIFRDNNTRVDRLSKKGLNMNYGHLQVTRYVNNQEVWTSNIPIP